MIIAAAVVGGIAAGVVAALKTQKGKEITGKVVDKAKAGVDKVKDKFAKKPDDVVAETTCEEMCEEEIYEDDLPEIAPEEIPTEEVVVEEEA